MNLFKKTLLATSIGLSFVGNQVYATGNSSSNIVGVIESSEQKVGEEYVVTVNNLSTGLTRSIETVSGENFRFTKLPIGMYQVVVTQDGEQVAERTVRVTLGTNANANFDIDNITYEEVVVEGRLLTSVDTYTMDSGLVMGEAELDAMPIARNLTAVSLLAPGVIAGDTGFGTGNGFGAASFGGASIAENSCYINGLEVTNTRQGIGCSSVPFEFYQEFQVKTGGYSAEFGRTTGGVVNAVTKSGGNTWEFGSTVYWDPDFLRSEGSVSRGNGGTGDVFRNESQNEYDEFSYTFSASGPIVQDKLFFYGLINPRDKTDKFAYRSGFDQGNPDTQFRTRESSGTDNLFWGAKIDWDITDNHRLSYFGFSDRNETEELIYEFDANTGSIGPNIGASAGVVTGNTRIRGSDAHSFNYTGYITDDLSISAMAGQIETEYTTEPLALECPAIADEAGLGVSTCGGGTIGSNFDENTQYRLDINYSLGDHSLKAGVDIQERSSTRTTAPVAGHSWTYETIGIGGSVQGDQGVLFTNETGEPLQVVSDRIFEGGGGFSSDLTAFYIEDQWQIMDDLMISIGLRKDIYEGDGTTGKQLFEFDTDIAPRLGFSWDPFGDGETKVYGTWGRYYLPIANNTIYRAASGVSDVTTYYTYTGIDSVTNAPTGITPINGDVVSSSYVSSVPVIPEKDIFQAQEAEPFARDEYILGFETAINDDLSVGVRGVYREVVSALDDYCGRYAWPYCVMVNPGESMSWYADGYYWDGSELVVKGDLFDGSPDPDSLRKFSAETIGLPEAKNIYRALQADLTYSTDQMTWKFIYTWSRSTGNFEGAVKSDIDQADAGVTQDFDFPALMDGAEGYQPNDRRHVFKLFGSYDFTEDLTFGLNATLASGRPISAFGHSYPSDDPNIYGSYGDTFYHLDPETGEYVYIPRGEVGRTPWTFNVDASMRYRFSLNGVDMTASLDIYNVFDNQEATNVNEHYELNSAEVNDWYGAAYDWTAPRSARIGLVATF
ncbi:TonB-dependent receptor plug domain-containing protein [Microbulbifer sp. MKSA007]|nr:TonB-dependent receptor plug domain-containing protein [Microbulbifer sp. MKSA007]